jgi:hypothetical protein
MRKNSGPDRRSLSRNVACIDVAFHIWDAVEKKPLTRKVPGRLSNISSKGACLQTSQTLIDGHHLMRDNDIEGSTPLVLDLPPAPGGTPFTLKAQILWYNRIPPDGPFHFSVGLKFIDISPAERKQLEDLIRSASTPPSGS